MKCIGLMSGTSMDGIDAGLIETDGRNQVEFIHSCSFSYPHYFQTLLKATEYCVHQCAGDLNQTERSFLDHSSKFLNDSLNDITKKFESEFHLPLTFSNVCRAIDLLHIKVIRQLLLETQVSANEIDVIGYHGQAFYHNPKEKITIQIGDGDFLAKTCNIPVVYDFRMDDIKQGGQGAPLAPLYHSALVNRDKLTPAIVINCGGIANITYIPDNSPDHILGFDTGPGNALLDRYVRTISNGELQMDVDGKLSQQGNVKSDITQILFEEAGLKQFIEQAPPKSLDSNEFRLPKTLLEQDFKKEDVCASLVDFTTTLITNSIHERQLLANHVILAGGGWHNKAMVQSLKTKLSDKKIQLANDMHWDNDSIEAQCFAYLAARFLQNLPTSYPNMTGVSEPVCGGKLSLNNKSVFFETKK